MNQRRSILFAVLLVLVAARAARSQDSRFREPGSQRRAVEGEPRREPDRSNDPPTDDAGRTERNAQYAKACQAVDAAWPRQDFREVLRLLYLQQQLRDGPVVQASIVRAQSLIEWYDAVALERADDLERALAGYQNAMFTSPDTYGDDHRKYVAQLAERVRASREKRAKEAADRRNRLAVDRLCGSASPLVDDRPEEAIAKLDQALGLMPGDRTACGLKCQAKASIAARDQEFDAALQALAEAQGYGALDGPAAERRLARIRDERRREGAGVMQALDGALARLAAQAGGDGMVVDARVPLRAAHLMGDVPELKNSPAADRISKGMQAVVDHDWPVALAWWQEALQRDPGNASLERSIELAQWMVDRKKAVAAGRPTPLGVAIHAAASGNSDDAIRKLEAAKADDPTIGALADHLIAEIRKRPSRAASQALEANMTGFERALACELYETGLSLMMIGRAVEADEAFRNADFFAMGLKPQERAWEVRLLPAGGCAQISGTSKLEFERE